MNTNTTTALLLALKTLGFKIESNTTPGAAYQHVATVDVGEYAIAFCIRELRGGRFFAWLQTDGCPRKYKTILGVVRALRVEQARKDAIAKENGKSEIELLEAKLAEINARIKKLKG